MPTRARTAGLLVVCVLAGLLPGCVGFGVGYLGKARSYRPNEGRYNPETGEDAGEGRHWLGRTEDWVDVGGTMGVHLGITGGPSLVDIPGEGAVVGENRDVSLEVKLFNVLLAVGHAQDGGTNEAGTVRAGLARMYARLGWMRPILMQEEEAALYWHASATYGFWGDLCTKVGEDCIGAGDVSSLGGEVGLRGVFPVSDVFTLMPRLDLHYIATFPGTPGGFSAPGLRLGVVALF